MTSRPHCRRRRQRMWVLARRHTSPRTTSRSHSRSRGELDTGVLRTRCRTCSNATRRSAPSSGRSTDVRSRWSSRSIGTRGHRGAERLRGPLQELAAVRSTSPRPRGALALYRTGNTSPHSGRRRAPRGAGRAVGGAAVPRSDGGVRGSTARHRNRAGALSGCATPTTRGGSGSCSAIRRSRKPAHEDLAYWTERLETAPQVLELPSDRSRSGEYGSAAAGTVTFTIPAELHAALEKVALEYDATPFMVVHAALVVLLARLSGSDDVSVGTPVSGRSGPGLHDLVGMLVGTVVLRATVDQTRSFVDLLGRIRRDDLDALAHAETPFDQVVARVAPRTSGAHHPLFQVMLAYENFVPAEVPVPGLDIRVHEIHSGQTRFDLEVTLRERDLRMGEAAGIDGVLTYSRDLFDHETVARWAAWLVRVLETVTDDPTVVVDAIDPVARGGVLGGRPEAVAESRSGVCAGVTSLGELFVQRAAEHPDAAAAGGGRRTHHLRRTRCPVTVARGQTRGGRGSHRGCGGVGSATLGGLDRRDDRGRSCGCRLPAARQHPASRSPRHADRPGRGSTDPARRRLRRRRSFARDRIPTGAAGS
ncbi:hypothetical protein GS415_04145 [Rhodococcus hoagii]|nr:hypothetical protein [Prescottella equi]